MKYENALECALLTIIEHKNRFEWRCEVDWHDQAELNRAAITLTKVGYECTLKGNTLDIEWSNAV